MPELLHEMGNIVGMRLFIENKMVNDCKAVVHIC